MEVPEMLAAKVLELSKSHDLNLKVIAGRAGVSRRALDRILYQRRAHKRTLLLVMAAFPILETKLSR